MRLRRSSAGANADRTARSVGGESKLGGVPPLSLDDDERPRREDLSYGETIFNRGAVPLPRWLTGRRRGTKRS